jgi:pantoate--beta-alanine ligase
MGALHAGHLSLVERAGRAADQVVASIFVNPLQFGPREDLGRYPRDLPADLEKLEHAGCHAVFAPDVAEMYAADAHTKIEVTELQDVLCGASRPGHFAGVATVVAKLFNIVQPDVAVFGQKDAQQALLLRRMSRDLDFPIQLLVAPIGRDPDGLALSSRNVFLSAAERREALLLHAALEAARAAIAAGERRSAPVLAAARRILAAGEHVRVDYVELVDTETLRPPVSLAGRVLLAVAAHVGTTRLIDNLVLDVQERDVREVEL